MIIRTCPDRTSEKGITISQRADRKHIVEEKTEQLQALLRRAVRVTERPDDVSAIRRVSEEVSDRVRVSEI